MSEKEGRRRVLGMWGSEGEGGGRREWVRGREKRESDGWRRGERAERMSEEGGRVKREKRCIGPREAGEWWCCRPLFDLI